MKEQNKEDYLRAIYHLWEVDRKKVRSVDIAEHLDISKASVSQMLSKLAEARMISRRPYSGVSFTKRGRQAAESLTHKHRVIEVFLKDVLGFSDGRVHEEAHRLEHAFSEYGIARLNKFLKGPKACPGGKKIPKN